MDKDKRWIAAAILAASTLTLVVSKMQIKEKLKMAQWLCLGLALYTLAWLVGSDLPAAQTVLYKAGHVTMFAWVGYWIASNAVGRDSRGMKDSSALPAAIVIAAVVLGGCLGL
ncbi:hypothetical protein [Comamonas koreensis]|uniref:hypothetical protein n=1 Tax=Comamonas koreensis TaxID=160825 RepID=UPI0015FB985C|nr:hypothetical protein [Comamonas koreensis]